MMKNNKKNKKTEKKSTRGITLIALVVTIIVLLILAGISIQMLTGDNGILQKATDAKTKTERQSIVEQARTDVLGYQAENKGTDLKKSQLKSVLDTYFKEVPTIEELPDGEDLLNQKFTTLAKYGTHTIKVSEIYNGNISEQEDTEPGTVSISLSIAGTKVNATTPPKPDNFYYVGGTLDSGYVISDNANDENKYASSENVGIDLQGNQFVWVPVEANQKITLNVTSTKDDITSIKLYDPLEKEISLGSVTGKIYNNTNITPTINGCYKAEVTTESGTEMKNLVVRSLYAQDAYNDYSSAKGKATTSYVDTVDYSTSVNTNGGFYIARYEAGTTIANRTSSRTNDTVGIILSENGTPVSKTDQKPYNYITQSQALGLAGHMYREANFTCTLPTGAAWDRTIDWIIEADNDIDLSKATYNSSDWGNYSYVSFSVKSTALGATNGKTYSEISNSTKTASSRLLTTGAAPTRNVSNNIFDLAGNVSEWTTEVNGSYLVGRGGGCTNNDKASTSSNRHYENASFAMYTVGFRVALFL